MANAVQSAPKYLPAEWRASNHINYSNAELERAGAEKLRAECDRLRRETEATIARTQKTNEHKFSQRIRDINFWKQELEKKLDENAKEINLLLVEKGNLEAALTDTQFPLEVANRCLEFRTHRERIDLVHDVVEIQLIKEVEVLLQGVQALLQKTLDQAVEQIRLLRAARYCLEGDLIEKLGALHLEDTCLSLTDKSEDIGYNQQEVKIHTNSITPDQWASFSNENILKTEKECNASNTLRSVIHGVLEQNRQDIEKQRTTVNVEFAKRIHETSDAKQMLEDHLEKVLAEIKSMEENVSQLKIAISDKVGPMMLAQTRLEIRSQRSHKELVRDPVQYGLIGEVGEITDSVSQMMERLADSEAALKGLVQNQLILEEDIAVKTKSLFIDQDQCLGLRNKLGNNIPI